MKSRVNTYFGLIIIVAFLVSCKKKEGYDPSYQDLVEYDSNFIGEWKTVIQNNQFYIRFDIPASGLSEYVSQNLHGMPLTYIQKQAKYNNHIIYLEDERAMVIDQYPTAQYDTIQQYHMNGPTTYVYSAVMIIDGYTLYRIDEIIE